MGRKGHSQGRSPRATKTLLAALVVAVAVVVFPALSGATPTDSAAPSTGASTVLGPTSATLNGTVTLNDDADGTYTFKWGTTSGVYTGSMGGTVPGGSVGQPVQSTITGLQPGTTYFYELCATNTDDQEVCDGGADEQAFTTSPAAPDATTGAGTPSTTSTSASLNGSVDPNGDSTTYVFHYDTTSRATCGAYASNSLGGPAGSGTSPAPVSDTITGLAANTKYFFRLSATNNEGTTCSSVESSFTTPDAPASSTGSATSIGPHTATLNGTVNPKGSNVTSAVFKYCTGCANASGGSSVAASPSPGSGTSPISVSASLSGLQSGASFHYMLCATNAYGTNCGADQTFMTDTPPTAALTADKTTGPTPLTVKFDGSGSSDPDQGDSVASYTFSFGDGSAAVTQSTPTVTHVYSNPCSPCTASVTVTDQEGAQSAPATVVIHANANQPPVATLTAAPTSGTVPLDVAFDGSTSQDPDGSIASWSLDFGDPNAPTPATGTGAVPSAIHHTYSAAGTYHAKLTVTDNSGTSTTSTAVTITVSAPPSISVANVSQNEGDSGTTNFVFVAKLSAVSTHDVTVAYKTADVTATAGSDYTAKTGTLTIPANTDCTTNPASNAACQITVAVTGDTIYENDETFTLNLSNPTGATLANTSATGTIVNDDPQPWLEIEKGATLEGDQGSVVSGAQSWSAGGNLQLNDASGFPSSSSTHTFFISNPGTPAVSGPFTYTGLSGNALTGVSPNGSVGVGQIAFQPNSLTIPVVLCDPEKSPSKDPSDCVPITSGLDTAVHYATSDGLSLTTHIPVIQGQDYVAAAGTLTIPAGQSSGNVTFETIPNTTPENPTDPGDDLTRWFNVTLTNPTNGTIASKLGIGTIIEDDGLNPPSATTGAASAIGTDHATVSATVNPQGDATDVYVQYGQTDSYGHTTATQHLAAGSTAQGLSFLLTGLSPKTPYFYQVVATHSDNSTGYGEEKTFTTDAAPIAVLTASNASGPVPLAANFNGSGSSDPDGSIASWTLSFGDGASTGGNGPVPSAIPHTYTTPCSPCTASLTVTDNQGGQSAPATIVVKAGNPTPGKSPILSSVDTQALGPTSERIVFPVNPNGAPTQVWIEYGKTAPYSQLSDAQRIPAGATQKLTFTLTGLSPSTAYHYRLVAVHTTDSGSAHSQYLMFSTPREKPMTVKLPGVVRATAKGTVPLPVSCRGNSLPSCKGQAQLKRGNLVVGSKAFSIPQAHRKAVSVKLKQTLLSRLLASSSGLHLTLTVSVRTGAGRTVRTKKPIIVLPPKS